MSIELMSLVFKTKLSPTKKLIMLELADHANDQGASIWPGTGYIVYRTSLSETTVRDLLRSLTEEDRLLTTTREHTNSSSTERAINLPLLRRLADDGEKDYQERCRGKKSAREGVPLTGTPIPEKTGGVPPTGTGVYRPPVHQYRLPVQGVPPTGPESLINHQLNPIETGTPPALPATHLWDMIAQQLRGEIGGGDYLSWVQPLKPAALQDGVLVVRSINSYGRDWCESRIGLKVNRLATALAGQETRVEFKLESE